MKKLNKTQLKQKEEHQTEMENARSAVEEAINNYNNLGTGLEPDWDAEKQKVKSALGIYNAAVESADEFRDEIHSSMEDFYDEKPERWQESDAGEEYSEFKDEWDNELEKEDDIEFPSDSSEKLSELSYQAVSDFEDLPTEI